jgi:hypothetical protein
MIFLDTLPCFHLAKQNDGRQCHKKDRIQGIRTRKNTRESHGTENFFAPSWDCSKRVNARDEVHRCRAADREFDQASRRRATPEIRLVQSYVERSISFFGWIGFIRRSFSVFLRRYQLA